MADLPGLRPVRSTPSIARVPNTTPPLNASTPERLRGISGNIRYHFKISNYRQSSWSKGKSHPAGIVSETYKGEGGRSLEPTYVTHKISGVVFQESSRTYLSKYEEFMRRMKKVRHFCIDDDDDLHPSKAASKLLHQRWNTQRQKLRRRNKL